MSCAEAARWFKQHPQEALELLPVSDVASVDGALALIANVAEPGEGFLDAYLRGAFLLKMPIHVFGTA
jgi:hypothetical protein